MASGTLHLRPSTDISVGHNLYPANSASAYLLISEEVSDDKATYICSNKGVGAVATSKFTLSVPDQFPTKKFNVTSVTLHFDPYCSSTSGSNTDREAYNEFDLEINGISTGLQSSNSYKYESTVWFANAILPINEFLAVNGVLPPINLTVISHGGYYSNESGSKTEDVSIGVTQVYLTIDYEEITDIGIHHKVNGTWVAATAAYQKQNGSWVEITEAEAKTILQRSFCTK